MGCLSGYYNLSVQASRLSSTSLQRSFFFFARMSCSEQSAFHGQAADPVWFFSELLFKASRRKRKEEKGRKRKKGRKREKGKERRFLSLSKKKTLMAGHF